MPNLAVYIRQNASGANKSASPDRNRPEKLRFSRENKRFLTFPFFDSRTT
jgi:hypothetical protein